MNMNVIDNDKPTFGDTLYKMYSSYSDSDLFDILAEKFVDSDDQASIDNIEYVLLRRSLQKELILFYKKRVHTLPYKVKLYDKISFIGMLRELQELFIKGWKPLLGLSILPIAAIAYNSYSTIHDGWGLLLIWFGIISSIYPLWFVIRPFLTQIILPAISGVFSFIRSTIDISILAFQLFIKITWEMCLEAKFPF